KGGGVVKKSATGVKEVGLFSCRASGGMTNDVVTGEVSGVCGVVSIGVVGGVVM
ncbi:hypothetical protein Tco_0457253, partial [Tanacetum coccineum]